MNQIADILVHAMPFGLVLARLAGLFLLAPMLMSVLIPMRYKALMVLMFAAALYPVLPIRVTPEMKTLELAMLVPLVLKETVLGFSIGLIGSIPLAALEMSGVLMSQNMGMGMGRIYNPELDTDADLLGQLLFYVASGAFFSIGGVEMLFRATINTFETVPIGGAGLETAPLGLLLGVLASAFELAIRVSAPVAGIVALLVILLGVLSKTMPQLNVMTVGFTIKMLAGLGMMIGAIYAIEHASGVEIERVLIDLARWVEGMRQGG